MSSSPELKAEKKRKRNIIPENEDDKLEIDVNLPEPPSKKAKRKEKKAQSKPIKTESTGTLKPSTNDDEDHVHPDRKVAAPAKETSKRSDYGIWVGNLSFKTTKDSLRRFLLDRGGIDESSITRLHMPMNDKQANKGFAYVDFDSEAVLNIALALSEKLVDGRKVLIKNAKSFEGRPEKTKADAEAAAHGKVSAKAPSKRVFVGNLSFDVTRDELAEHFAMAGQVEDVFLATFEDSGKCKGFGWVTFADLEASEAAVRGYIWKQPEQDDAAEEEEEEDEDDEEAKKLKKKRKAHKPRKWFINKVNGRLLKCEYAEDKVTRYNKRFGKGAAGGGARKSAPQADGHGETWAGAEGNGDDNLEDLAKEAAAARDAPKKKKDPKMKKLDKDARQDERRRKHDARMTAPGQALANAQRATGAIVAGAGKKVTFD